MSSPEQHIAIIDLGSNTARLVIMQSFQGHAYRLVDEIREVVRLREGMTAEGLSEVAVERAFATLQLFKRFCDAVGVDVIYPTATSAVRDAGNGPAFVERVYQELGISLEILTGEREAYYGAAGALNEVPMVNGFIIDIGGGSMQISEIRKREFIAGHSLPLGALALTERFIHHDPPTSSELKALQADIQSQLDTLPDFKLKKGWVLAGLGGTIRNLAKIESKRQNFPLETLHGFALSRDSIAESIGLFSQYPFAERKKIPGLSSDRADIILPGALVIHALMERLGAEEMIISINGLREGVFLEKFWAHRASPIIGDVRRFSVLNMARLYNYHKDHANHVRHLSDRLFTGLMSLHGYGTFEREILETAALLHDLGVIINYADHHKHSAALIINRGLAGYTPRETALIALLARYHRKGTPALNEFESIMQPGDTERLVKLAAILRLTEYLERGRNGTIKDLSLTWDEDTIHIAVIAENYPAVELWVAEQNALPLFEEAFRRKVIFDVISAPVR